MNLTSISRISRRKFTVSALALTGAAAFGRQASAQSTPVAQASPVPAGESLVLRIDSVGGLRPMETYFLQTPSLSIYADGTVIQPAPVTAIYPPVAITPLNTFTISKSALAEVIKRATNAKLNTPQMITNSLVMDAGTAQITFTVDGAKVISSIYALQVDGPRPPEWNEETAELFAGIQAFAGWVSSLATSLVASDIVSREAPYEVERLQVIAFEPDEANPLPTGVPDTTATPLQWPLETSLAKLGAIYEPFPDSMLPSMRCAEISGNDAKAVIEEAAKGNLVSPWEDQGKIYGILFNPILPGDSSCQ